MSAPLPYTHESALASLGIRMERLDWIPRSWRFPRIPPDLDQRFPYYHLVPKDVDENIEFRIEVLRLGQKAEHQYELWLMCRRDPLFWMSTFLFIQEPRGGGEETVILPWIPYPFQVALFAEMQEVWGREYYAVEKARAQGISWLLHVARPCWDFQFSVNSFIGLCSKTADDVDASGSYKPLMAKIGFLLENQPYYLKPPDMVDKLFNISSKIRGNVIDGEATTGNMFRGDRRKVVGRDEAAECATTENDSSLASVTDSLIDVSTPKGAYGSFYRRTREGSTTRKATCHWTLNPEQNKGLYFDEKGKPHSPWYDNFCAKLNHHPVIIAQELDISYEASAYQFFVMESVRRLEELYARPPVLRGVLKYEVERDAEGKVVRVYNPNFVEQEGGWLSLWCQMRSNMTPVRGAYAIGCDISMGVGSSDSVAALKDCAINEKVAEIRTNDMEPGRFAETVAALGQWFGGPGGEARVGFERNGPGLMFLKPFVKLYHNIYLEELQDKVGGSAPTMRPGWWSNERTKPAALKAYATALYEKRFIEHSIATYAEHPYYIMLEGGKRIEHSDVATSEDPTAAGDNHGDGVIANMVCEIVSEGVLEMANESMMDDSDDGDVKEFGSWDEREAYLAKSKEREITRY